MIRFGRDVLQSEITRTLIMQRLQQVGESVSDEDLQREIQRAAREYGVTKTDGMPDIDKWIAYVTQNDSGRIEILRAGRSLADRCHEKDCSRQSAGQRRGYAEGI